jgi:hypothetical protein
VILTKCAKSTSWCDTTRLNDARASMRMKFIQDLLCLKIVNRISLEPRAAQLAHDDGNA